MHDQTAAPRAAQTPRAISVLAVAQLASTTTGTGHEDSWLGCLVGVRPLIVEPRSRIGDGESNLIVGRASRSAPRRLADRTTRCLGLIHLPAGHTGEAFAVGAAAVLGELP